MKREIKFRGKSYVNDKFVYGNLDVLADGRTKIYTYKEDGIHCHQSEVDPATVGQYTGLKDKDGVEIYEGDILLFSEVIKCVVEFRHGMFGYEFCRNFIGFGGNYHFEFNPSDKDNRHEVIGNIHDNPELLEEKE